MMATSVPASTMLEHRLNRNQYDAYDVTGMMSTFNMSFRPLPADPALSINQSYGGGGGGGSSSSSSGGNSGSGNHQHIPLSASAASLGQFGFVKSEPSMPLATSMAFDQSLPPSYQFPAQFHPSTFGDLVWPDVLQAQQLPMQHPSLFREQSYSSSNDSDPYIKHEYQHSPSPSQLFIPTSVPYTSSPRTTTPTCTPDGSEPAVFSTEVDNLMRAIQSKSSSTDPRPEQSQSPNSNTSFTSRSPPSPPSSSSATTQKRYRCPIGTCSKTFTQKTHLEIHTRAHTGLKPYICPYPDCSRSFSQHGNLKTHERRHTGERPYTCEICGKTFAQHGNVRAHKIVHSAAKPFVCRLDACGKQFTQLGNLKSHQNKFHVQTIRQLQWRFGNLRNDGHDNVEDWEREMWEYFTGLYKNCNKGIKGRGKDRRTLGPAVTDAR